MGKLIIIYTGVPLKQKQLLGSVTTFKNLNFSCSFQAEFRFINLLFRVFSCLRSRKKALNLERWAPSHTSPVLRGRHPLSIAGQSRFFFYGVHRDKQVTWLHPPSRPMEGNAVQTVCGRRSESERPLLHGHGLFTCKCNIVVLSGICTHRAKSYYLLSSIIKTRELRSTSITECGSEGGPRGSVHSVVCFYLFLPTGSAARCVSR